MPDNYLKVREKAKQRERLWTSKDRIFNYLLMIVLVVGLALYPILRIKYLITFIIVFVIFTLILKKLLS